MLMKRNPDCKADQRDERHRSPEYGKETTGRCRPCGLIFYWKSGRKRRLSDATCPRCGRDLSQTTTTNILLKNASVSDRAPVFVPRPREVSS